MSRRSSRRSLSRSVLPLGALLAVFLVGCHQETQERRSSNSRSRSRSRQSGSSSQPFGSASTGGSTGASNDGNLVLGNPSGAATDANNYLLDKPQYSLSFNHRNGGPNWVAWHVDTSDFGDTDRSNKFAPDPALPREWQVTPGDYRNSGYDKGHMCPSADRTSSVENNVATFYMSNMLPQTGSLNRHVWADFENYVRDTVRAGNEVYQIAGPAGNGGTIDGGNIVVPRTCWKIVVVLPAGNNDLRRITTRTRVIAVVMPNADDKSLETADWRSFITTPRKIEDATHLDFFSALPSNVKLYLEQKTDSGQ